MKDHIADQLISQSTIAHGKETYTSGEMTIGNKTYPMSENVKSHTQKELFNHSFCNSSLSEILKI
ncbi:hypothetical protein [Ulvibacterium marinum]|uniref:hypothetical protein n=1 Tax=Ulvibacterium marinum TaxID=2419782 RepID=UPI0011C42691|nr:hypothetical protein [Ulvibacterium marinum]